MVINLRRSFCIGAVFILTMALLSACAPSARVPVLEPAEINLRGIDKIAVGNISGNVGPSMSDLLTSRLFESGKFTVVDRNNLNRIMKEQELDSSGAVDTATAVKMGKLIGAACLVAGNANMQYQLRRWRDRPWKDKEGKWHQTCWVKGTAKVSSTLRVIGLTTGQILAVKSIYKEESNSNFADRQWPLDPDRDALVSKAENDTIDKFMKMIAPYTVYVTVTFEKSKLPESKAGVDFAKKGLWKDALAQFKLAKTEHPTDPCCWYNLGLGYEYNFMFRKAINAFEEANKIKPSDKYISEIANVNKLREQRYRLEQQGAIETGN